MLDLCPPPPSLSRLSSEVGSRVNGKEVPKHPRANLSVTDVIHRGCGVFGILDTQNLHELTCLGMQCSRLARFGHGCAMKVSAEDELGQPGFVTVSMRETLERRSYHINVPMCAKVGLRKLRECSTMLARKQESCRDSSSWRLQRLSRRLRGV